MAVYFNEKTGIYLEVWYRKASGEVFMKDIDLFRTDLSPLFKKTYTREHEDQINEAARGRTLPMMTSRGCWVKRAWRFLALIHNIHTFGAILTKVILRHRLIVIPIILKAMLCLLKGSHSIKFQNKESRLYGSFFISEFVS